MDVLVGVDRQQLAMRLAADRRTSTFGTSPSRRNDPRRPVGRRDDDVEVVDAVEPALDLLRPASSAVTVTGLDGRRAAGAAAPAAPPPPVTQRFCSCIGSATRVADALQVAGRRMARRARSRRNTPRRPSHRRPRCSSTTGFAWRRRSLAAHAWPRRCGCTSAIALMSSSPGAAAAASPACRGSGGRSGRPARSARRA